MLDLNKVNLWDIKVEIFMVLKGWKEIMKKSLIWKFGLEK